MRTRIIIICAVALAVCIWLLLRKPTERADLNPSPQAEVSSKAPPSMDTGPTAPPQPVDEQRMLSRIFTNIHSSAASNRIERALDDWRTPISFYGAVVDQNTNPVVGAPVDFDCNDLSPTGTSYYHTQSDADGLFSIQGIKGKLLGVKVMKEGYYPYLPFGASFFYAGENENFVPNINNPVVFYLRKKGVGENLVKVKQNYRVSRDGTPIGIDLTTGKTATGDNGHLLVQCWTEDRGKRSPEKYDWRCTVAVPGGGLVLFDEAFPFLAPEAGYKPTVDINMPSDRTNWNSQVDLKFYYRLADGRYGRMTFSMIAGGQHFCMIDSVLNPSGSRNLEPAD